MKFRQMLLFRTLENLTNHLITIKKKQKQKQNQKQTKKKLTFKIFFSFILASNLIELV